MATGSINPNLPIFETYEMGSISVPANTSVVDVVTIPQKAGYSAHVINIHITDTENSNYGRLVFVWAQDGDQLKSHIINSGGSNVSPSPLYHVLYIPV